MQLNPRYGRDPVLTLDGVPADVLGPAVRQRRRMVAVLRSFDDEQWDGASRCEAWSNRDVVSHLGGTNLFWTGSISAGLDGSPTEILGAFDPVLTPAELVAASGESDNSEVLDRLETSTEAFIELIESMSDGDWLALAEAPPGHVSVSAVVHHALWDSWVHERDVLCPLGIEAELDNAELAACLRYVAGLGPAMHRNNGHTKRGTLAIDAVNPSLNVVVDVGDDVRVRSGADAADLTLVGETLALLEALSFRAPLDQAVPPSTSWLLAGLAEVFDAGGSEEPA